MKKSGQQLVLHVSVDTGEFELVDIIDENGDPITSDKGKMREIIATAQQSNKDWPRDGIKVGKIMINRPVSIIIYDDSDDCIIIWDPIRRRYIWWNP